MGGWNCTSRDDQEWIGNLNVTNVISAAKFTDGIINISEGDLTTTGTISNLADNSKHTWGEAGESDAYIQFDGTDLKYFSKTGGVHSFSPNGIVTLGTVGTSFLEIKQLTDTEGLKVSGYDDRSSFDASWYIDSFGQTIFKSDGTFSISTVGANRDLQMTATRNIYLTMSGDNTGADKIYIRASGSEVVATVDTDGNIETIGDITFIGTGGLPFAEIYVKDSVATISLDADNADVLITQFTTNGQSNNCTADAANDKITFTKIGKYLVTGSVVASIDVGSATTLKVSAYLNGSIQNNLHAHRAMASNQGDGSISLSGIIDVTTANWDLDLRANVSDTTARAVTFEDLNLSVVQIGGT